MHQTQTEHEKGQRLLVAPLDVVQGQQNRAALADETAGESFEEAMTLPGIGRAADPTRRAGIAHAVRDGAGRRHQSIDLGAPYRSESGAARGDRGAAQPVGDRRQRQPAGGGEASAVRHCRAARLRETRELGEQPGLSDTRAAANENRPWSPGRGPVPCRGEPLDLA